MPTLSPAPPPRPPIVHMKASTSGSAASASATRRMWRRMSSKATPCAASAEPLSVPMSWFGTNPFGTTTKRTAVSAVRIAVAAIVARLLSSEKRSAAA